jgi:hypothetical protein
MLNTSLDSFEALSCWLSLFPDLTMFETELFTFSNRKPFNFLFLFFLLL